MADEIEQIETTAELSLFQTIKMDFAEATGRRILGVLVLLVWLAFQWGWGNDILLPPITTRAFEAVDDGETWASAIASVVAGTGAGSLFWAVTQALDCIIVLTGLQLIPHLTARISRMIAKQGWMKPVSELSFGIRFFVAFLSGASLLCLADAFTTGESGVRSRWSVVIRSVALAVSGVALAVAVVLVSTAVGRRVPATAETADFVIRYARNPLTWLVIYGSLAGGSAIVGRLTGGGTEVSQPPE